jgi:hypothetical protein
VFQNEWDDYSLHHLINRAVTTMNQLRTHRETLQVLPISVQYVLHDLCGKCLSKNIEIPPKCSGALLH